MTYWHDDMSSRSLGLIFRVASKAGIDIVDDDYGRDRKLAEALVPLLRQRAADMTTAGKAVEIIERYVKNADRIERWLGAQPAEDDH